jgi:RpiB/LacA/LacB family sugar-phosphate isomerase
MADKKAIAISADHAGYELKEFLKTELTKRGVAFEDLGAHKLDPLDGYPVYASRLAVAVAAGTCERGITLCGTGIGASIAANRHRGVRAALCTSPEMAKMSRLHNNANVLVMGGRTTPKETAVQIMDAWLNTAFEGDRHVKRIQELDQLPAR